MPLSLKILALPGPMSVSAHLWSSAHLALGTDELSEQAVLPLVRVAVHQRARPLHAVFVRMRMHERSREHECDGKRGPHCRWRERTKPGVCIVRAPLVLALSRPTGCSRYLISERVWRCLYDAQCETRQAGRQAAVDQSIQSKETGARFIAIARILSSLYLFYAKTGSSHG
jgi:hypothetical protein